MKTFFIDGPLDDKKCELALMAFPNFEPTLPVRSRSLLERVAEALRLWTTRAAERRQLAELDDRTLDDIGLTRTEAIREASKPFWR